MTLLGAVFAAVFVSFLLIVFRGAPFVPTRKQDMGMLFELHRFRSDEVLVDLGSGDGRVLEEAARRGVRAVGYELNPFLVWFSRIRLSRHASRPEVYLADFWRTGLPDQTAVVFVFLAGPFMAKLDRKLKRETARLGHDITLISYGVPVPGKAATVKRGPFLVYRYKES